MRPRGSGPSPLRIRLSKLFSRVMPARTTQHRRGMQISCSRLVVFKWRVIQSRTSDLHVLLHRGRETTSFSSSPPPPHLSGFSFLIVPFNKDIFSFNGGKGIRREPRRVSARARFFSFGPSTCILKCNPPRQE